MTFASLLCCHGDILSRDDFLWVFSEQTEVETDLWAYIWEVFRTTEYFSLDFPCFLSVLGKFWDVRQLGANRSTLNPFQCIIRHSHYHSTLAQILNAS
jgi:hypothetical protein